MLITGVSLSVGTVLSEPGILADAPHLARPSLWFFHDAKFVANSRQSATNLKLLGDTHGVRCDAATAQLLRPSPLDWPTGESIQDIDYIK